MVVGHLTPDNLLSLEAMVREARSWALVDPLAHTVAGTVLTAHPEAAPANVDRWSLDEREFFIGKAIGWALREVGRHDPASVEAFCRPRMARMTTVTWREAQKRLAPAVVAELAALR